MTDELSIQQQRPSALPYLGVGGAVGGAAGYFGLPKIESVKKWITEPAKYGSFDDIIKESEDSFVKTAKEVIGDSEKDWKAIYSQIKNAGEKWDGDLATFIKDNAGKTDLELLPKDHELIKNYTEKKSAKLNELIKDFVEKQGKTQEEAAKLAEESIKTNKATFFKEELAKIQNEKLKNAFIKESGSKKDAINKALNEAKDDVSKLVEGKLNKGKFALVIGGTAAAAALLALLFRPKSKEG